MIGRAFGVLLMAVALWDVFITVLYARAKGGIIARAASHLTWQLFRGLAELFPGRKARVLAYCGPAVLIMLVAAWALMLTLAAALILQPALGEGIRSTTGDTATDFMAAIYAAGGSLAIVGASGFTPHGHVWELYFLFNSLVGASVISLTLTYLMQVYSALLRRNSFALTLHLLTNETDDAADLICGLGPHGDFQTGATTIAQLSTEMAAIKETHHFYPVLFYFRFQETFYSVSHVALVALVALDTATLIKTALDQERYAVLQASGSLRQLSYGALIEPISMPLDLIGIKVRATPTATVTCATRRRRRHAFRYPTIFLCRRSSARRLGV